MHRNVRIYRRSIRGYKATEYTVQELTARVGREAQRRGVRRNDGSSRSDERGPKNGFGKPLRNESVGRQ